MKIKKFKIENYRAIEDIELNLTFSINPIMWWTSLEKLLF